MDNVCSFAAKSEYRTSHFLHHVSDLFVDERNERNNFYAILFGRRIVLFYSEQMGNKKRRFSDIVFEFLFLSLLSKSGRVSDPLFRQCKCGRLSLL